MDVRNAPTHDDKICWPGVMAVASPWPDLSAAMLSEYYLFVRIMPDLELGVRRCRALDFVTLFLVKEMYCHLLT
jgi:hypothetical protein